MNEILSDEINQLNDQLIERTQAYEKKDIERCDHIRQLETELNEARAELEARGSVARSAVHEADCACPFCEMQRELAAVTKGLDELKRSANFHRDLGITTMDAKWLDPECHKGCQSLVYKHKLEAALAQNAQMRKALDMATTAIREWCDAVDADASWDGWDSHFKDCKWKLLPKLREALSNPPPAVVPMEDVEPLLQAISRLPKCSSEVHPLHKEACQRCQLHKAHETFTTKHPSHD